MRKVTGTLRKCLKALFGISLKFFEAAMSLMEKEMYQFGPFSLDPAERLVSRDGAPVSLTPKVFDTLVYFVRNRGRLLTKDELLKEVWPDTVVEEVNLAVNVSTLRKLLGEGPQEGRYIVTVPGQGYRFVAAVQKAANKNENTNASDSEHGPITGNSFIASPGVESSAAPTGLEEPQKSNGPDKFAVTPIAAQKNRPWNLRVSLAVVILLAAAIGSFFWLGRGKKTASASAVSVAVLPFADLSSAKDQEYFSDGLTDELINDLAKVPGVRVVARSSAFQFKGKNEDVRSVGRKLGVANILEGSLRRERNRVRIMAELIKVDDGFQLWSATYDREMDDVFNVQDEIARSATAAMRVKLVGANAGAAIPSEPSPKPEAYQAYLQAQAFFGSGEDKGNLERALASADEAIKFDPDYAPAWALRSYVRDVMAAYNATDMEDGYARARQDAKRAIELNPRLATGYLALGWIQMMHDWDWQQAEDSLNKAAQLEPGSVEVLRYRSSLLRTLGRLDEAIDIYKEVVALDPLRARTYSSLGGQLYCAGRYEEADAMLQKALELNPKKEQDHLIRGQILLAQGRPQQALTEIEQEPSEIWKLVGQALAYHSLGRPHDSDAALQQLIATRQEDGAMQIAGVYAFRGESDKAFEWLERAYRQRDGGVMFLKINPLLKSLRQDPRYAELLTKMHLPA
jgi:TolB-like protein/DNA-binding winged helix-turn-helix (wHTH) protein/Tfp pilus assembly protein PilF